MTQIAHGHTSPSTDMSGTVSADAKTRAHCGRNQSVALPEAIATVNIPSKREVIADTLRNVPFVNGNALKSNGDNDSTRVICERELFSFGPKRERDGSETAAKAETKTTPIAAHQPPLCQSNTAAAGGDRGSGCRPWLPYEQWPAAHTPARTARRTGLSDEALEAIDEDERPEDFDPDWDRAQAYNDYMRDLDA